MVNVDMLQTLFTIMHITKSRANTFRISKRINAMTCYTTVIPFGDTPCKNGEREGLSPGDQYL